MSEIDIVKTIGVLEEHSCTIDLITGKAIIGCNDLSGFFSPVVVPAAKGSVLRCSRKRMIDSFALVFAV